MADDPRQIELNGYRGVTRLGADDDFRAVVRLIELRFEQRRDALVSIGPEAFGQAQGQARALRELLDDIDHAADRLQAVQHDKEREAKGKPRLAHNGLV